MDGKNKMKKFSWSMIHDEGDKSPAEIFFYAYYGEEELGFIEFYKPWKKWVWNQNKDIIMSLSCLEEVVIKLAKLLEKTR